ncbi:uncharacterized protein LOC103859479 isoform X1 [Brassica rapa]|uniref:uncharacterized protein LOC103859479 isoform X1 n=1 Tax=Brassica campestris TaxID=3711 RepID=UPI00142DE383|nr:uncharacterized protein LOC103859479 isoform X1 [Brassica rapa]
MSSSPPLQCRRVSLHRRETFSDLFEPAISVVIPLPFPALTTQPLQLKLTVYPPRRAPSLMDLSSRPPPPLEPPDPPDPPDRATSSQSKTFTVIVPFFPLELVLVDPKNLLVLSVSHSLAYACDFVNLLVSTLLKLRTLEVFVVLLDGLNFTRVGSRVTAHVPLSTIYVNPANPATNVGGTPLRRPDLFFKRSRRQSSSSDISLPRSILSIPHVWPPPEDPCHQPPQTYLISQLFLNLASDVGGNPLRRPALSHLFVKLASDVGGNPLRRSALSHRKLVRSCCRRTTLISSSVVESTLLPCLLSMNGENFSDSFPSFNFSLLTGLLPCGAVCMGPEGAIETTLVLLVGEGCLSTSLVTISQRSDFVVKALSTHSILVLNSLSTSYEDLSCLVLFASVVYEFSSRGCLIPSWLCSL